MGCTTGRTYRWVFQHPFWSSAGIIPMWGAFMMRSKLYEVFPKTLKHLISGMTICWLPEPWDVSVKMWWTRQYDSLCLWYYGYWVHAQGQTSMVISKKRKINMVAEQTVKWFALDTVSSRLRMYVDGRTSMMATVQFIVVVVSRNSGQWYAYYEGSVELNTKIRGFPSFKPTTTIAVWNECAGCCNKLKLYSGRCRRKEKEVFPFGRTMERPVRTKNGGKDWQERQTCDGLSIRWRINYRSITSIIGI